jgi:uncharacterized protein YecT (DUF1311 family)
MLALLAAALLTGDAAAAPPPPQLDREHLVRWIAPRPGCEGAPALLRVVYRDFDGDGRPEAVVNGSACPVGSPGADVNVVLTVDASGKVSEVPREEPSQEATSVLFGNRSCILDVEEGKLVARWKDGSGRTDPLVVVWRFEKGRFALDSVKRAETFPASYDCGRATKEVERAICSVSSLAALDRQLDARYRALLGRLSGGERESVRLAQQEWLDQRDDAMTFEAWVERLTELYQKRIAALEGRFVRR